MRPKMLKIILVSLLLSANVFAGNARPSTSADSSQVDALKTEVTNSQTQVMVLKDLLRKEGLDGSRRSLLIAFDNKMTKRYLVDSITYKLNGDIIYQYVVDDTVEAGKKYDYKKQFETKVVPGPYTLEVQVVYRGNDTGVFSYVKDYRITREEKLGIDVKKNKSTEIHVSSSESGGILADFKDRPQLKVLQN
jgi:hypothetical protein